MLLIIKALVTHKLQIPTHKKGRRVVHVLAGACFVDFRYTQLIQKLADCFLTHKSVRILATFQNLRSATPSQDNIYYMTIGEIMLELQHKSATYYGDVKFHVCT